MLKDLCNGIYFFFYGGENSGGHGIGGGSSQPAPSAIVPRQHLE
ncbi:MAG: hypothetical protein WB443_11720 [Nitrososphaeraceae archaeon]